MEDGRGLLRGSPKARSLPLLLRRTRASCRRLSLSQRLASTDVVGQRLAERLDAADCEDPLARLRVIGLVPLNPAAVGIAVTGVPCEILRRSRVMGAETAKVAYDEAVRTITAQASVLDNLRTRATAVLTVATLITTFLGGQVLAKPVLKDQDTRLTESIGGGGWVAIGALVGAVICAALILWPWNWRFDQSGTSIQARIDQHESDLEAVYRQLTKIHDRNHDLNSVKLNRLFLLLQLSFFLLLVETVAWIEDLRV